MAYHDEERIQGWIKVLTDAVMSYRSTYQRLDAPTARAKTARSILNTKSHNTKLAKWVAIENHLIENYQLTHNLLGLIIRARKAKIRSQAVRLRWSDQTRVQEKGKDNQEGRVEIGVHIMQDQGPAGIEAMQTL